MDPIEVMVNHHADEVRNSARNRHFKKHGKCILIATAVAAACLLFALIGLVHPSLAMPLMVVSLMWGCYHLGRGGRFGKQVR